MIEQSASYLDAAASAPLRQEARTAMLRALDGGPGNASSVHSFGHRAKVVLDDARTQLADALGARRNEVVFTSGGTEANNLAVIGIALARPRGRHVVTTAIEHSSVLESCRYLQRVHAFEVTEVAVDAHGLVSVSALAEALRDDTTLVSIGLANGEIGTVQAIQELADVAHARGALVHTDAVQAAVSLPVSFRRGEWPGESVDALTIASHKFGGPQGAGALLLRSRVAIEPLMHGGGQEGGRRSGTENVMALAAFAAAVTAAARERGSQALKLAASRDRFVRRVLAEVPGSTLTGHPLERVPGHASFTVRGVSGESLLVALDAAGIAASSGSACAAGKDEPSPVLLALGVSAELAQSALRFTLHRPLDDALIERVVRVLVAETRSASARA